MKIVSLSIIATWVCTLLKRYF